MKHMERSVNDGLVALATSDLFLCLVYFVVSLYWNKVNYDSLLELYYRTYQGFFINYFLLVSTWLTVMMAVSRYIAIGHPLHARSFINQRGTRITIFAVWLGSFIINLPRFWRYQPKVNSCHQFRLPVFTNSDCSCVYYQKLPLISFRNSGFSSAYTVIWATVAIFVPLAAMIVSNWCLVKALRKSSAMQQRCCRISSTVSNYRPSLAAETVNSGSIYNRSSIITNSVSFPRTPTSAGHRITPTLIALIVLFLVLVGPSEMLTFAKDYVITLKPHNGDTSAYFRFRSAVDITNLLLLINFASNVVLYCAINVHFRRVVRHIFLGNSLAMFICQTRRRATGAQSAVDAGTMLMKPTQNSIMMRTDADVLDL